MVNGSTLIIEQASWLLEGVATIIWWSKLCKCWPKSAYIGILPTGPKSKTASLHVHCWLWCSFSEGRKPNTKSNAPFIELHDVDLLLVLQNSLLWNLELSQKFSTNAAFTRPIKTKVTMIGHENTQSHLQARNLQLDSLVTTVNKCLVLMSLEFSW